MAEAVDKDAVDNERSRLIDNFMHITGSDVQKARENLEWSGWDLGVALERYYGKMENPPEHPEDSSDDPDMPELVEAKRSSASDQGRKKSREERTRIGTIADLEAAESSGDDEAQAYYAGGSENSGQQVLGPPSRKKKKDIIADILKSVQQIGAEVVDTAKPSSSSSRESFSGTGYRLGVTETDSQVVPSTSRSSDDSNLVTLKLWKEGFNVNDGPLREYEDPENKQFLDSVRQGVIPPELTSRDGSSVIQLNLEDHHHESYVSVRTPRVRPFSGQGHVLGRPTPAVVRTTPEEGEQSHGDAEEKKSFEVDETKPMTTIAIRLPDGTRLNGVFNHTHTVGDIRTFISQSHPEYAGVHYSLQTTIPIQELTNNSVTIARAGLISSVLIMKLKQ